MKRNTVILWLIAPAMLIAVILAVYLQPTVLCAFQDGDAIDEIACVTEVKLRHYDEQPQETIKWLFAYHGEGTGQQVMYSLAEWAMKEPDRFIDLLSRIDDADLALSSGRMVDGVRGYRGPAPFKAVFDPRADESERLRDFLERLR